MKKRASLFIASIITAFGFLLSSTTLAGKVVPASSAVTVKGLPPALIRPIIDLTYPVGSLFLDGTGKLKPPGQGYGGIVWAEQVGAQGHILMGYSSSGDWPVGIGNIQGTLQTTDPHVLTQAELPAYDLPTSPAQATVYQQGNHGATSGGNLDAILLKISSGGGNQPHVHSLTGIARFGVKIWKRTS